MPETELVRGTWIAATRPSAAAGDRRSEFRSGGSDRLASPGDAPCDLEPGVGEHGRYCQTNRWGMCDGYSQMTSHTSG